jgi:hypothetical protein
MKKPGGRKLPKAKGKRQGMQEKDKRINVQLVTEEEREVYKALKRKAVDEEISLRTLVIEGLKRILTEGFKRK